MISRVLDLIPGGFRLSAANRLVGRVADIPRSVSALYSVMNVSKSRRLVLTRKLDLLMMTGTCWCESQVAVPMRHPICKSQRPASRAGGATTR